MKRPTHAPSRVAAAALVCSFFSVLAAAPALAQVPSPWAVTMQAGFSPVKRDIIALNHLVLGIIIFITLFVGGLLVWVIWRYNAKRHPVPTSTSHNTVVEIAWTVIPILILVAMAIPSFRLVYYEDRTDNPDLTVKVTGHQWYWEYTYPELKNLDYSSYIIPDDKLQPGQLRLLTVDNDLVLPVGKNVRLLETSGDVIHSFFIPSLGVQRYAIPGRTIETWVRIDKPGVYYGECNQICGTNHSRMPIVVRGVTPEEFQAWVGQAQKQFAADAAPTSRPDAPDGVLLASATTAARR
ncbi:MAG: cytochrome c oxidase subunit II [Acetobacteraceae bacterium]